MGRTVREQASWQGQGISISRYTSGQRSGPKLADGGGTVTGVTWDTSLTDESSVTTQARQAPRLWIEALFTRHHGPVIFPFGTSFAGRGLVGCESAPGCSFPVSYLT